MATQTVTVGPFTLTLELLKVGELKRVRDAIVQVLDMRSQKLEMPTAAQIDAMITIVHASAVKHLPELTLAQLTAAFDDLEYSEGIRLLTRALAAVFKASGLEHAKAGEIAAGEAGSPAESISPGSTD